MSKNEKTFDELINELVKMYQRLRNSDKNMNIEIDGDFDLFVKHYESIKSNVNNDILGEMEMPLKEMLETLLEQLHKELDDDISIPKDSMSEEETNQIEIAKIDDMLKKENISTKELNELLDKRSALLAKIKTQ